MHGDAATREPDDFAGCPPQYSKHGAECEDSQNHFGARIVLRKLPQAQDYHLRETNEHDPVQYTLEYGGPAIAEVLELIMLHSPNFDKPFADELEQNDAKHHKNDKDKEEDVSRQEDVGLLDSGAEANTLNTPNNYRVGRVCTGHTAGVRSLQVLLVPDGIGGAFGEAVHEIQAALLHLNGGSRKIR